jgi:hypothetical protein
VLWVLRDCLSGAGRRARRWLSATQAGLAGLLRTVRQALTIPMLGLMADGQHSIRWAVADVLPDGPPQWWHCHALRESAKPPSKADRQAKHACKQRGRGVRPITRPRARGKTRGPGPRSYADGRPSLSET